ncbi:RING/U-box superfamily protein, putative isoform 2 [Hibiscus syriacus]|uniref:RING-type E3 ubiquitin transferase n=1 Tax=Hibiscus syriacus TaxID=106335 RepID=A0A6A2YWE3_HIBSY|nr:RING/U-box superfamily protein, putative isoform 2 [Hibiscus syriacus]
MQGQRGTLGSLPETLFDHSSTSNNAPIEQQFCWNNIQDPMENRLPNCFMASNDMNIGYVIPIGREGQLGRWSLAEPTSSGMQNEVGYNERKTDHGWSLSMSASSNVGPRLEGRRYEESSLFTQSFNSDAVPQNQRLNAGLVGHGDNNCQVKERSSMYKPSGSENEQCSLGTGPEAFLLSPGSSGYVVDDSDSRPGCSYEGRRASCKRKALEGNVGQSSSSGSSGYYNRVESGEWHGVSANYTAGSNVNISPLSRQAHPRLGLDIRGSASDSITERNVLPPTAEISHRNFRLRINPSGIQEPIACPPFSTGDSVRQSIVLSAPQSSGLLPTDHSLDLTSARVVRNASSENPNVVINVPTLLQNGGSGSRTWSSSNSNLSADRDVVPRARHQSRSARNLLDHRMLVPTPELRTLVRNPGLSTGSINAPGNVALLPVLVQILVSMQRPHLLGFLIPTPLCNTHKGPTASPEEIMLSSRVGNQAHHHSYPRSFPRLERQDDGLVGIPPSLRTLAFATEGRSRLVASEIRNVLDIMRGGENLRFEDVMILDQSVLLGVADIHDWHRDMRLDVDNMSYEELLALEERIGNVSTGLSEETILNRLKRRKHSSASGAQLEAEPCCVCQEEYNDGEDIGTLECGHDFHADCIKQWLMHKNLCPICKTTGLTK